MLCACEAARDLSALTAPSAKPQLEDPPAWMLVGCSKLKKIPEHALNQKTTEAVIAHDTKIYEDCYLRYYALRNFYRKRDDALRGLP